MFSMIWSSNIKIAEIGNYSLFSRSKLGRFRTCTKLEDASLKLRLDGDFLSSCVACPPLSR
jgi:hypothetical protein